MTELLLHAWSFRFRLARDPSLEWLVERARADGFAGVGLNANGPHRRLLEDADPARLREALGGLDCDLETTGTDPGQLAEQLDLAAALGARHLHTYALPGASSAEAIRDLAAIGPIAEDRGVPVLIENHEELTGVEVARILEAVDHPFVGALFDYGNAMMVREDPLDALDAMLPWVRGAHLKDHVVMHGLVCGVPIGEGVLPIAEITRRLADAGMTRIAFENVWGYTAPFRPRADGLPEETDANPVFRERADPGDSAFFLPDVDAAFARDPDRVIALEELAYLRVTRSP